ncbi:hypothetical protein [Microbispora sp. NPDC046933]|uniref:hypothetical protein n=1 Tax=Microbispora sp. NPDC046933 TaxID=3155618 RepID=UPI0033E1A983
MMVFRKSAVVAAICAVSFSTTLPAFAGPKVLSSGETCGYWGPVDGFGDDKLPGLQIQSCVRWAVADDGHVSKGARVRIRNTHPSNTYTVTAAQSKMSWESFYTNQDLVGDYLPTAQAEAIHPAGWDPSPGVADYQISRAYAAKTNANWTLDMTTFSGTVRTSPNDYH